MDYRDYIKIGKRFGRSVSEGGNKAGIYTNHIAILPNLSIIKPDIITAYHSGHYVASLESNAVDPTKFNVLEHQYRSGLTTYTDWNIFQLFELKAPVFDIHVSHYTLAGDRMNFNLYFYDNSMSLLGSLEYHKDSDTWSTADYSTIKFKDASNNVYVDMPASNYSGTTYGNGYFRQTVDFSTPDVIKTYASTHITNTHQTTNDYTYNTPGQVLINTRYVKLEITYTKATYDGSVNGSDINCYISNGYEYFGPLVDR